MSARAYLKPIALVSIITALALLGDALLYSILPLYAGSLGISTFMVGVLLSANRWVRLATNTWAARSFARWDFSGIMLAVVLLTALSTAVYAFPLGAALFFLARIIWGACYSHLRLGGYLVALKASGQSLGLALGTIQSVSRSGSIFAVLGGGLLADRFGYSWALAAAGLLSLGAVPFVLRLDGSDANADRQGTGTAWDSPSREQPHGSLSAAFASTAGLITHLVAWGMVLSTLSAVLQERVGQGAVLFGQLLGIATVAGAVTAINWLSTLVVSPLAGRLCDRWGRRGPFLLATLLQAGSLLGIAVADGIYTTIGLFAVFFVLTNAQKVFLDAAAGDAAQRQGAGAVSRYNSWQDLGSAAGPLLGYGLAAVLSFSTAYVLGAILLVGVALLGTVDSGRERRVAGAG